MRRKSLFKLLFLVLCLVFSFDSAQAQTSAFTYQGKLTDMSAPANGQYDFTFRLFDAATNGEQIGTNAACNGGVPATGADAVCDNIQVTGGIFTVNLNFGANAFSNGAPRFLEISVRAGASTGAYTLLSPRQQVTSAPFSIKSLSADSADALSSACVLCVTDGQIGSIDGSKVTGTVANAVNAANATTANNVSGIVAIANGGTGSATKNFVDLFSNQSVFGNKTFNSTTTFNSGVVFNQTLTLNESLNVNGNVTADQFHGNGDGLVNVPGTFKWQYVSGLSQQAQPNNGYLATNDAQVTITLPTSIGVGETVRVSGGGTGGWKIAQNDKQTIIGIGINFASPIWTPREGNRDWSSVASSADGTKLAATVRNGQIYTSTDSGVSWTPRESNRDWTSIASSADGTKLVATVVFGQIYTSTDSGVSWTPRESNRGWASVSSSADGTKLVAVSGGTGGRIYTSTDSGVTWTPRFSSGNWTSVTSSADGTKLAAAVYPGHIYVSTDSGLNWVLRSPNLSGSPKYWRTVASSADGTKLVAGGEETQIFTSYTSGSSWTPRETIRWWISIASSADGSRLAAVTDSDQIYISTDSGISWTGHESTRIWTSVASSADGTKLVATARFGQIYTANIPLTLTTTPGTAGFLTGRQYSSIELQYIGNGQFLPLSYSGAISGF